MDFRRLKKMCRGVRPAVSARWRRVTIFGFVVLCLAEPGLAGAQETTDIPPLGSDQDAAGQAPKDASAPPPAGSTTTVATPREATSGPEGYVAVPSEVGRRPSLAAYGFGCRRYGGVDATDPQTMPHFRHTTAFHGFNRVFTSRVSRGHYCCGSGHVLCGQLNSQEFLRSRYGVVGR
jgi:hypothetical protein